jgi:hypothetical protein
MFINVDLPRRFRPVRRALTRCERERYVVVGDYAGKAFGYSPQLEGELDMPTPLPIGSPADRLPYRP